jgi:hypothetical protein
MVAATSEPELVAMTHLHAVVLLSLLATACHRQATTSSSDDLVASPSSAGRTQEEHPTVAIDLSPSGIAATIRGPDGAKASAGDGFVKVDAEPDFHMEVHRGPLDPLEEKADLVRRWGPAFQRFVQDDGDTVIYETDVAGDNRYHFFSAGKVADLLYHCRSDKRGAESIEAVQLMIVGCHAISAHDHVTPQ